MFQLHDRTRRRIAMMLFVLLCLAPTVVVSAWCVSRRLPGHVRDEAERLGLQLGAKVSLEAVRHPQPGVVCYEGLVLSDLETGSRVLACRELEASWASSLLVLTATQPEIEAGELETLQRFVERLLVTRAGWPEVNVQFKASELAVRTAAEPQMIAGMDGRVRVLAEGTLAQVKFGLPGELMREPVQVYLGRRQDASPMTVMGFSTGGAPLPCSVLGLAFPECAALGPASRFVGKIDARQTPEGWAWEVQGDFLKVDLGRLVDGRFPPHQLAGTAELKIASACLLGGRLQSAAGSVRVQSGRINRSLLSAAASALSLRGELRPESPAELPCNQFAAQFQIDSQGLRVRGACDSQGTLLTGPWGRAIEAYEPRAIPWASVVQMLAPDDGSGLANPHLCSLERRLPRPELFPPSVPNTILQAQSRSANEESQRRGGDGRENRR